MKQIPISQAFFSASGARSLMPWIPSYLDLVSLWAMMRYFKFIMSVFFFACGSYQYQTNSEHTELFFCSVITKGLKWIKLRTDVDAKKVGGGLNLNGPTSTSKKIINHKIRATDIKNVWSFLISNKCKIYHFRILLLFFCCPSVRMYFLSQLVLNLDKSFW